MVFEDPSYQRSYIKYTHIKQGFGQTYLDASASFTAAPGKSYHKIKEIAQLPSYNLVGAVHRKTLYPAARNVGIKKNRKRVNFVSHMWAQKKDELYISSASLLALPYETLNPVGRKITQNLPLGSREDWDSLPGYWGLGAHAKPPERANRSIWPLDVRTNFSSSDPN